MRSQVYRGFPGERESGLNRKYVRVTFPETDTAMPGMGQRRINDLEPKRTPEEALPRLLFMKTPVRQSPQRVKAAETISEQRIRNDDGSVRSGAAGPRCERGLRFPAKSAPTAKPQTQVCDPDPGGESRPELR